MRPTSGGQHHRIQRPARPGERPQACTPARSVQAQPEEGRAREATTFPGSASSAPGGLQGVQLIASWKYGGHHDDTAGGGSGVQTSRPVEAVGDGAAPRHELQQQRQHLHHKAQEQWALSQSGGRPPAPALHRRHTSAQRQRCEVRNALTLAQHRRENIGERAAAAAAGCEEIAERAELNDARQGQMRGDGVGGGRSACRETPRGAVWQTRKSAAECSSTSASTSPSGT